MSSRLVFTCTTTSGKRNFSYNYADPAVAVAKVKALAQGLITYASLFKYTPSSVDTAQIVTTTTTDFDLSGE